jgi:cellulose biosynthesis protein BcsQ
MDMQTFQTLACADYIISPAFPDDYSEEGLELTKEEVDKLHAQGFKPILKIVPNKYREKKIASSFFDLY